MTSRPIRVLCVDDHSFLVDGLEARFSLEDDLILVGKLDRADNLMPTIRDLKPNIVVLDIEMPGCDPFDAAAELKRLHPEIKVVFLSAYVRDHYISSALKAGAWGYFSKSEPSSVIIDGLRKVAAGEFCFSPMVAERCQPPKPGTRGRDAAVPTGSKLETLSPREIEVLRLIGRGLGRTEIAQILSRSPKTIDGHRESIMAKLGIHDRTELVRYAIREGLAEV